AAEERARSVPGDRSTGSCGETAPRTELLLVPDRPALIGRAEGYEVPYLDPAYRPTTVVPGPGTGQSVLGAGGEGHLRLSRPLHAPGRHRRYPTGQRRPRYRRRHLAAFLVPVRDQVLDDMTVKVSVDSCWRPRPWPLDPLQNH